MPSADVIAAIATPPGEGAIGMLRLSGPDCLVVVSAFVRWREVPAPRRATLCEAHAQGGLLDRVVLTFFPGPHSYTGEDMMEIAAHGSPYILSRLLEEACRRGARLAEPGEFTQRAFLNGRIDLSQAEAVCALIRSRTRRAHRIALEQLEGGLSRKMNEIRGVIVDLLSAVEAQLDHPEEEIPVLGRDELAASLGRLRRELQALLGTYRIGKLAMEGARIAIVGRPNVGKSSLLNALLGRDRAIVSDIPGTTRDTLEEAADLDGMKAVLIDTAGLRESPNDPIEDAGIHRARSALRSCDLALLVLDRSHPIGPEDRRLLKEIAALDNGQTPVLCALNKADLPAGTNPEDVGPPWKCVEVSALRGDGVRSLVDAVSGCIQETAADQENSIVLTSLRHHQAIEDAITALKLAGKATAGELAALHLREALTAVGAVIGETTSDDILRSIFSKFCIGK